LPHTLPCRGFMPPALLLCTLAAAPGRRPFRILLPCMKAAGTVLAYSRALREYSSLFRTHLARRRCAIPCATSEFVHQVQERGFRGPIVAHNFACAALGRRGRAPRRHSLSIDCRCGSDRSEIRHEIFYAHHRSRPGWLLRRYPDAVACWLRRQRTPAKGQHGI